MATNGTGGGSRGVLAGARGGGGPPTRIGSSRRVTSPMRSLSLWRGAPPYCGGWPVGGQPSMRLWWHSRNPEGRYSPPIRTTWRRWRPTLPMC